MINHRKITIVLITPSTVISEGIKQVLQEIKHAEIHTFSDMELFTERAVRLRPDVVLLDPVVVDYSKRHAVKQAFSVLKDMPVLAILYAVYDAGMLEQYDGCVHIYDTPLSIVKKVTAVIESRKSSERKSEHSELSDREKAILVSVAQGLTNKEIADNHHISIHTVISHRKNITRKTGIKSVSGLTVYALLNNLVKGSDFE